ncbi:MAG TPA: alcohol dehydrogenase catalytic domain-containing protein [Acidimicrobiales bacterium]|jgi:threonine dehydrogenase-like Zn-dependent dehydrogenase
MKALVFGVTAEPWDPPPTDNPLVQNLAKTPMALTDIPDAQPLLPDWVVVKPRMTGICGSDSKQALLDFGETEIDNAMGGLCSFPQVMGHEVVADVVSLGPQAEGLDVGQRVVLNPWLSCVPRGVTPVCPSCEAGDLSLCWNFQTGPISKGIHTGVSSDATGGYAELLPAHTSMLFPVPDGLRDEQAVLADPFAVSLHSITRHPPAPGSKVLVYGAGALGTMATAILRALHPDVEVAVVARFDAQADLARRMGASLVLPSDDRLEIIEELTRWSGGRLVQPLQGLPMAHPGGIDVVYDTIGKPETFEVGVRVLRQRGTLVKSGVHGSARWEWSPLYFKEISWVGSNAFGIEEVEGRRQHGIQHYLDLAVAGRVDVTPMLTHTFRLEQWREAFCTIAEQGETGAVKVAFDFR